MYPKLSFLISVRCKERRLNHQKKIIRRKIKDLTKITQVMKNIKIETIFEKNLQ